MEILETHRSVRASQGVANLLAPLSLRVLSLLLPLALLPTAGQNMAGPALSSLAEVPSRLRK